MQQLINQREELALRKEELKLQAREQELSAQVENAKLQMAAKREGVEVLMSLHQSVNIAANIKLVPPFPFNEQDIEVLFCPF